MIKIDKDLSLIPPSLMLPNPTVPGPASTTHNRRMEVIAAQKYPTADTKTYNDRYKQKDIKDRLEQLYYKKCVYCETRVEQYHVEHYRPKSIYYWLAYSWDNLLLACSTCNQRKKDQFAIEGTRINFENTPQNIDAIHTSSSGYDLIERPRCVNPEVTDPFGKLKFFENGKLASLTKDDNFDYTINTCCKLNRQELQYQRQKIWNDLKEDIKTEMEMKRPHNERHCAIKTLVCKFKRDSQDPTNTFLAFRRFAIGWLPQLLKEILTTDANQVNH